MTDETPTPSTGLSPEAQAGPMLVVVLRSIRALVWVALTQLDGLIASLATPPGGATPAPPDEWPEPEQCGHERKKSLPAPRDAGRMQCVNPRCNKLFKGSTK